MSENQEITIEDIGRINDDGKLETIALTHPNYEVRIEATNQIKNQDSLNRIALESKDWQVRLNAARYLEDSKVLADIVKNETAADVRTEALRNPHLKNQNLLMAIFKSDKYQTKTRKAALNNPNFNRSVLFELAHDGNYLAYEAIYDYLVERYAQEEYSKYKIYSQNNQQIFNYYIHDVQHSKIERIYLINDEETLNLIEDNRPYKDIFNSKNDWELLNLAKSRPYYGDYYLIHIEDETLLIDYMQDEKDFMLKESVSKYINDDSSILDYSSQKYAIKTTSIENIREDTSLEYLALKSERYLEEIISKIQDPDILINIAFSHHLEDARSLAVLNLNEDYVSDYISLKNYDLIKERIIRETDFRKILNELSRINSLDVKLALIRCMDDEEILERILFNERRIGIKRACVRNIKDSNKLLNIIKKCEYYRYVVQDAVANIDDEDILIYLAESGPEENVRKKAIERITNEDALVNIAKNDSEYLNRRIAIRNPNLTNKTELIGILEKEQNENNQIEILEKLCGRGD